VPLEKTRVPHPFRALCEKGWVTETIDTPEAEDGLCETHLKDEGWDNRLLKFSRLNICERRTFTSAKFKAAQGSGKAPCLELRETWGAPRFFHS
jgi:hypothetical protein